MSVTAESRTRKRVVVRKSTTSAKEKNGLIPVEMIPYRERTEKQRRMFAARKSKADGIDFDDALAIINQEEADKKKFVEVIDGKEMVPATVVPRQRIAKGVISKPKKKRKRSAVQKQKELERRQKAEKALELRTAGVTYQKIADSVGYGSASAAKTAIDGLLKKQEFEAARDVVLLDLQRLDEYQMRCTERLRTAGDLGQIDRLMRVMEMRYRILGVNEETTAELQQHFGLNVTNKGVMVIQGSESEFVKNAMQAVGIDTESEEAKKYLEGAVGQPALPAPMRGAEEDIYTQSHRERIAAEEIVDAEIVEELG
jgi:hypothetical protein